MGTFAIRLTNSKNPSTESWWSVVSALGGASSPDAEAIRFATVSATRGRWIFFDPVRGKSSPSQKRMRWSLW
jgi:hypothetical protein